MKNDVEIVVSIDNVTLVGQLHERNSYALQKCLDEPYTRLESVPLAGKAKGIFFHGNDGGFYFEYDSIRGKALNRRNFRMEYNPNNVTAEQKDWLKVNLINKLDDIAFSRCDLATDINVDLSSFKIEMPKSVKSNLWFSPSGKLETLYKGSPSSQHRLRMYDKNAERADKNKVGKEGDWWRVEHQIRGDKRVNALIMSDFDAFQGIRIIDYDFTEFSGSVTEEKLLRYFLLTDDFSGLSKNTIAKYRKMIKELSGIDVVPKFQEEIKKELPKLKGEFEFWKPIPNFFEIYNRQWG